MPHELSTVVRSTEIDVNHHVNNAKYLEYLEWGREDWYEGVGLDYNTLRQLGAITVVAHISANYRREAKQNDVLRIRTKLEKIGRTSFTMVQEILNQRDERVLDAEVVIVTVDPATRVKTPVPQAFHAYIGS